MELFQSIGADEIFEYRLLTFIMKILHSYRL